MQGAGRRYAIHIATICKAVLLQVVDLKRNRQKSKILAAFFSTREKVTIVRVWFT